ncbi:GlsB/YeaQ/YmgE family stress response membrane protein [Nocardioides insulae]|uniref:GlsB/YeaQ/YmgE family stress response membrane protein n=1 Tax=Nocardioides insulae TaxID=394734 RepID=UPI000425F09C|nr:GlsB/YeaQ/YmgE family stress response membrane protein [Nocardioides insulae]
MFDFWTVLYLIVVGVVAGYLARLLVKGPDPMSWWQTILLGIVGSFIGGLCAFLLFGWDEDEGFFQPGGLIFSILGAVLALLLWRVIRKRLAGSSEHTGT